MYEFQVYNSQGKLIKTITGDYIIPYNNDRYEIFEQIGHELICVIPKIFIVQINKKS